MKTLLMLSTLGVLINTPMFILAAMVIITLAAILTIFLQGKHNRKECKKLEEKINSLEHEAQTKSIENFGFIQEKEKTIKRLVDSNINLEMENASLELGQENLQTEIKLLTREKLLIIENSALSQENYKIFKASAELRLAIEEACIKPPSRV